MPELIIENINNLDKQSDPTQIPLTTGVEVKDLSTTKKPGSLVKAGNYEDDPTAFIGTPTIPAGLLIRSMSEMPITRPESKDIYIIHAQDAAIEDHLYVGPFYDGTTFQNGLLKVTDKITSRITITASDTATTTTITIDSSNPNFSLFSQTDDEYNGWFMDYTVNTGEAAGFKILDYAATAASVVLTVSNVIPGTPGTNDFFNLGKYPILGTNLTGPDIGGITPIDNGIRFVNRENLVIGMTGNQFPYPDQYQLWYGFINRSFGNEVVVANLIAPEEFSDFWCDTQQMMKPFVTDPAAPPNLRGIVESVTQGAGNLTAGEWEVAFAYEYDGFQIGPLSDPILSTTAANKDLTLIFQIPYNSNNNTSLSAGEHSAFDPDDVPNNYNPILLSRRITGLFIFAKEPATETFRLVTATVATEANPSPISGFQPTPGNAGFSLTDDGLLQDAFAFSENPIGVIYETFVGQTGVRTNFKFGLSVDDHFIVAAIINEEGEPLENHLIASTIQSNAVAAVDNFGGSNEINLGFYGSKNITGLILIEAAAQTTSPKRRMVVFTDDDLYVLQITSGAVFSFSIDAFNEKEGCSAPDSIVQAEGRIFYVSRTGFRALIGGQVARIGEGLRDEFAALTAPGNCISGYLKRERLVIFHFKEDRKTFYVDLNTKEMNMLELFWEDPMVLFFSTRLGELGASNDTDLFTLFKGDVHGDTFNRSQPLLKSKLITSHDLVPPSPNKEMIWIEGTVNYKSDTRIEIIFEVDGRVITFSPLREKFPIKTTAGDHRFRFPLGTRGDNAQISLKVEDDDRFINTVFELNYIRLTCDTRRKFR